MTTIQVQPRVNKVMGFYVDKLDRNLILTNLNYSGNQIDPKDSTEQLAMQLAAVYQDLSDDKKIRCNLCKAIADEGLDTCPFCGHDEGEPVKQQGKAEAQPMEEAEATDNPNKGKKKKKEKKNGASSEVPASDLKASTAIRTERELDEAVKDVDRLKSDAAGSYWQLGHRIREIHDQQLWKLRTETDEKGKVKPRWKTWESFCNGELSMTPKSANSAIDVSQHYSEEQVRLWGRSKLDLLLRAPPIERERILKEKVEKGASAREVEAEVRKAKSKSGFTRPTRGNRGGKTAEAQAKSPTKQVTIASLLGVQTIKAYKKPATLKGVDWKEVPRAKRLADQPIGVWNLLNDVVAYISVSESAGGELQFKINVVREEE